jgi:molecular chaperone DnaK (HSP70)/tetratricopeptide (TPR) repeat protein
MHLYVSPEVSMLDHLASLLKGSPEIRVLGIDLGTTNSVVSGLRRLKGKAVSAQLCETLALEQPTREGPVRSARVPSFVASLADGQTWVGEGARRLRGLSEKGWPRLQKDLFYDSKNDMGLRLRYPQAAEAFDRPWKIGGHLLRFLAQEGAAAAGWEPQRVVVTVPAAFQVAQRRDTLEAAKMAGLQLGTFDLLDEPTAALIDYLVTHPQVDLLAKDKAARVLVFDFGGGTCDVSIAELTAGDTGTPIQARLKATSRYHRLGGGDLDDAIVAEHLLPALLKASNASSLDFGWAEKRRVLMPLLRGTAEALKEGLCREVERLESFGRLKDQDRTALTVTQPDLRFRLCGRDLHLPAPRLDLESFEALLAPFLDLDHLGLHESEYRISQSIFAPLTDALDRARMGREELDAVLLVGGSSRIPQVRRALQAFFPGAKLLHYAEAEDGKSCVSRGAAWHALALQATGRPLIQPVTPDELALATSSETSLPLVPAGASLPFPSDGGFMRLDILAVPRSGTESLKLELRATIAQRTVLEERWDLGEPLRKGEPITLEYRLGASQEFECRAWITRRPELAFQVTHDSPLTHLVNPLAVRLRIEENEAALREKARFSPEDVAAFDRLGRDYAEIHQCEKALDCLRAADRLEGRPNAARLNHMGILFGRLGDRERERRCYKEAHQVEPGWDGPPFNEALLLRNEGRCEEAVALCGQALKGNPSQGGAPVLSLRAQALASLGRDQEAKQDVEEALRRFDRPESLDSWELHWFVKAAQFAGRQDLAAKAEAVQRRSGEKPAQPAFEGPRPALRRDVEAVP